MQTNTTKTPNSQEFNDLKGDEGKLKKRVKVLTGVGVVLALLLVFWSYLNYMCATTQIGQSSNGLVNLFYGDKCSGGSAISSLPDAGDNNEDTKDYTPNLSYDGTTKLLTYTNEDGTTGQVTVDIPATTPVDTGGSSVGPQGPAGTRGATGANGATGATGGPELPEPLAQLAQQEQAIP